ncbi:MAG TPA: 23S rRNA (guanosine(2251)-2'-O)-methyltransferase RlmB [Dermatophilaceae bacterium]|nr:23S rRNA (guanosine(2251)-2'-O)-methyltransferase RlmB [Dermatophilaceae bacterium]
MGRNAVAEALSAGVPATALYLAPRGEADDRITAALRAAQDAGIPILETTRPDLDRLSGGVIHQGILATLAPFEYADPIDLHDPLARGVPLVVALDGVTDPRNLGAVIRSVAAFGGHGVLIPQRRSVEVSAGTWKASAGTVARVPVAKATNLTRALEDFQRAGFFVVGLDADGDVPLPQLALGTEPLVLVVGSEGKGLSRLVRATCDVVVSIPMASAVESLNVGVAAGIALYQVACQRAVASLS